jgi:predicted Ser/Thr protein kinase
MAVQSGDKLGPYECIALIGEGGMGEVWKAHDPRLKRDVAIKVSAAQFSERFEREAQAIAALNHPNICQLYDVGPNYLVMEYIEGAPLKGPLPVDQALKCAAQICDALDAAHKKGITHRDLKPANILVTKAGIKLLDFGLAKLGTSGIGQAPKPDDATLTMALTGKNEIVGTLYYMSPEQLQAQANGQEIDARSDIFSFGIVLYEMLTGKRAFEGASPASVIAAIMERPAPSIADVAPAALDRVLKKCLAKDPDDRWQTARDLKSELDWIASAPESGSAVPAAPLKKSRFGFAAWSVAALFALLAAALASVHFREAPPVTPLVQTDMPLPDGVVPGYGSISPDGTKLVVRGTPPGGRPQLYLRPLGARAFAPVPGTENVAVQPFWSPDSQWIAFGAGGKLLKWNVTGGQPPQIVCNADMNYGSWGDDGVILFSEDGKPIQRVPAAGGTPRNALELDSAFGEQSHNGPFFLPGGKAFLFTSNGKLRGATFFATLDGKVRRHLFDNINGLNVYVANPSGGGFLAYTTGAQLFARPFNPATGEFLGEAVLLVDGVVNGPTFSFGGPGYLAYMPTQTVSTQLRYYGGDGKPGETLGEPGELTNPQLSPDGKRVMFDKRNSGKYEIWLSGAGGDSERIAGGTDPVVAIWTPDGRILYSRREAQESVVIERPADALGAESILARIPGNARSVVRNISANGKVIALSAPGGGRNEASLLSRPGGNARPANLPQLFSASGLALSPDGRWLTYVVGPSPFHIFVRAVPDDPAPLPPGDREIASIATPVVGIRWSADGKELLFLTGPTTEQRALMSLPIVWNDGTPRAGVLRRLFDAPRAVGFDVTTAGRRFIVAESLSGNTILPIVLVQNWSALLRK